MTILLSRTDSIGDVVLTLPLAGVLKSLMPESRIVVLCAAYTRPVVETCSHVDALLDWTALATLTQREQLRALQHERIDAALHVFPRPELARLMQKAGIGLRIGTRSRFYHWWTCNRLVSLSRKNSEFHEAVLNSMLLRGLNQSIAPLTNEAIPSYYGLTRLPELPNRLQNAFRSDRFNCVIHPKSHGSAPEWSATSYEQLLAIAPPERFHFILTGTESEGRTIPSLRETVQQYGGTDLIGTTTLEELIAVLHAADGVVASSTGPLHIASALGCYTLGLFSPVRPVHPERWRPLGMRASVLVPTGQATDIDAITPYDVARVLLSWANKRDADAEQTHERSA
jgi:heptosyltransferase III